MLTNEVSLKNPEREAIAKLQAEFTGRVTVLPVTDRAPHKHISFAQTANKKRQATNTARERKANTPGAQE